MAWTDVRDEIYNVLVATLGTSTVTIHKYTRHEKYWGPYLKRNSANGRIHAWELSRISRPQDFSNEEGAGGGNQRHITHMFRLVGRMSVRDTNNVSTASETVFQGVVESIVNGFDGYTNALLNNTLIHPVLPQVSSIGYAMWGGVLVHEVEIVFECMERKTVAL